MNTQCYRHEGRAKKKNVQKKNHEMKMKITQVGIGGNSSDTTYHRELYLKIMISHFHLSEVIQKVSKFWHSRSV